MLRRRLPPHNPTNLPVTSVPSGLIATMGFKDWYSAQNERNKQWKESEAERKRERSETKAATIAKFKGIVLQHDSIEFYGNRYPTRGAKGVVEIGSTRRRTTATRLVVGSMINLGVGTAIGAMAKKETNKIYLTVELANGQAILVEAKSEREGEARRFAAAVTTAGAEENYLPGEVAG